MGVQPRDRIEDGNRTPPQGLVLTNLLFDALVQRQPVDVLRHVHGHDLRFLRIYCLRAKCPAQMGIGHRRERGCHGAQSLRETLAALSVATA